MCGISRLLYHNITGIALCSKQMLHPTKTAQETNESPEQRKTFAPSSWDSLCLWKLYTSLRFYSQNIIFFFRQEDIPFIVKLT